MAQQNLNVGTTANDGTGDTLRASQIKVQSNFDELYARPDFTDAPSDGNTYGRKDGTWDQVTGGSGTTPTLNEVVTEGNEIINTAGNLKLVLDKEDNGIFLYELVSSVWEERGYYNSQGFTLGGFDGTPTFDLNIYTGTLSVYQGTDIIQFSPTSATKNGVEFATEDYALKRDGSNANSDVDLGAFGLTAKRIKSVNTAYPDGFMDINPNSKIATIGDINNALFGTKLVISDGTGEIDFAITDTENFRVNGQKIISTPDLANFKTTEYLDATSSIQGQLDSKQPILSYTPYKFVQTSQALHTGTTSETIVATETISGGVFNANDSMKALFKCTKVISTSNVIMRLRINTTNSLSGSVQIATLTLTTANVYGKMNRTFDLNGGNLYGYNFSSSLATDNTATNTTSGSTAYNTANTLYFFWTVQLGTAIDSVTPNLANLTN